MAESFPAFLRSLERSIEPLESIAGVAPPFRDEDDVEGTDEEEDDDDGDPEGRMMLEQLRLLEEDSDLDDPLLTDA